MAKYREFKGLDLPAIDKEILAFWEENKVFEINYPQSKLRGQA